jgi:hypothetical protein
MKRQIQNLREQVGLDEKQIARLTGENPRRAIGIS